MSNNKLIEREDKKNFEIKAEQAGYDAKDPKKVPFNYATEKDLHGVIGGEKDVNVNVNKNTKDDNRLFEGRK